MVTIKDSYFCKKCKEENEPTLTTIDACDTFLGLPNSKVKCLKWDIYKIRDEIIPLYKEEHSTVSNVPLKSIYIDEKNRIKMKIDRYASRENDEAYLVLNKVIKGNESSHWKFMLARADINSQPSQDTSDWFDFPGEVSKAVYESTTKKKIMENTTSTSEKIDDKLRELNFYSADESKGKKKIEFTDTDRDEIKKHFATLLRKYPEDVAFVRAVVITKGIDKKTDDTIIKLGSYFDNSDINLPFKNKSDGLGKVLDGGINYFTIINNVGPDDRDFRIEPGDTIKNIKFDKEDKPKPNADQMPPPVKDEPFEQVMQQKERKGLSSLISTDNTDNNLTKHQKSFIEKLRERGYIFRKPVDVENYEHEKIKTREFSNGLNVWKHKNS